MNRHNKSLLLDTKPYTFGSRLRGKIVFNLNVLKEVGIKKTNVSTPILVITIVS